MEKLLNIASKVGVGLLVMVFIFLGLKGFIVNIWMSPSDPTTYAVQGEDGRSLTMIFMPGNDTFMIFIDQQSKHMEAALTHMKGTYGTHYFWRLWNIRDKDTDDFLGFRLYPKDTKPVKMEIKVLDKFVEGTGKQNLLSKGDSTTCVIIFSENAIRFENMWLVKESTNRDLVNDLSLRLKALKTK